MTQVIDPDLVDAVLEDTGAREQRVRLLPSRVVLYFVLAFAFFENASYQAVWGKLTAGVAAEAAVGPCASSLSRARTGQCPAAPSVRGAGRTGGRPQPGLRLLPGAARGRGGRHHADRA
ncbi:transposase domain-containing protein [Streptomyces actuosus]|uniref:Transposase domain-containing protein n=1 Tax=Streptomyces actuosus TaxID=1885 RepID=A0ABS2VVP8_STRAS|nr:transposase domain-containing protein [Streptomyces actuosus]